MKDGFSGRWVGVLATLGLMVGLQGAALAAGSTPSCSPVGVSKWVDSHLANLKGKGATAAYPGEKEIYYQTHRCLLRAVGYDRYPIQLTETIVLQRLQQDSGFSGDKAGQVRYSTYYLDNIFYLVRNPQTPMPVQVGIRGLLLSPYVATKK